MADPRGRTVFEMTLVTGWKYVKVLDHGWAFL